MSRCQACRASGWRGIALATRRAKQYGVDGVRWREESRARAAEHGFGELELARLCLGAATTAARSEAEIVETLVERLSGPEGLTAHHNTFSRRHVLAEAAGEVVRGARVGELERLVSAYLEDGSVVALGADGDELRYTTQDLIGCERAIVEVALRRPDQGPAVLDQGLCGAALRRVGAELSAEQAAAVLSVTESGRGVDLIQALAGTGKTRVLGALAGCYRATGYQVVGVAPTGRTARELSEAIGAPAHTLHGLIAQLDRSDGLLTGVVVLFDEAAMAPTRQSASLFNYAERAGAKVIATGDAGQLPPVQAGGCFSAVTAESGGAALRQVMRQRDPGERAALAALHDGEPDQYLAHKEAASEIWVHGAERDAADALLAEWNAARLEHGTADAVMVARDNTTRELLNDRARLILKQEAMLAPDGFVISRREFCVGDRVIARRNDRRRDVDNGTRATVSGIDRTTGTLTVAPDFGGQRELDAAYAAEHLEHAYALTGHGAQGATVEWAGVIGRPEDFSGEWAYTALSRARGSTRLHLIAEPTAVQRERDDYAPVEPARSREEALDTLRHTMRHRELERLAVERRDRQAPTIGRPPPEPGWRALAHRRAAPGAEIRLTR